jgi:hypothetical protein
VRCCHDDPAPCDAARQTALPFSTHLKYSALVYSHGFCFQSSRWRGFALMGAVVVAEEAPCKEWWQLLLRPHEHYVPTTETFSDLLAATARAVHPQRQDEMARLAAAQREVALRALSGRGLLDYTEELWRQYAALGGAVATQVTRAGGRPGVACAASHGTPLGGPLCCGQRGVVNEARQVCPRAQPLCDGFRQGLRMGRCTESAPTSSAFLQAAAPPPADRAKAERSRPKIHEAVSQSGAPLF